MSTLANASDKDSPEIPFLLQVFNFLFDFGFIFFPSIGYIHQYIKINRLKSTFGFSKFISLVLIAAYVFRIFFWIGEPFGIVLLLQSIVGIITQLLLIRKCVEYTPEYYNKKDSDFFNINEFWNWPKFLDYFYFVVFCTLFLNLFSNLIGYDNIVYVQILGGFSAATEAMLGIPQIIEIYKTKSVKTLSYILIISWVLGDSVKIYYYISKASPVQLIACGVFQLFGDFVIIFQIIYYTWGYKKTQSKEGGQMPVSVA